MKTRTGFVSNSSSSSFIVIGEKPDWPCVKLSREQAYEVVASVAIRDIWHTGKVQELEWNPKEEEVYLTPFISDCHDMGPGRYSSKKWPAKTYDYCDGGHGEPYSEDIYDEIECEDSCFSCWIRKTDNPNSQEDFIKRLFDACGPGYDIILTEILEEAGVKYENS